MKNKKFLKKLAALAVGTLMVGTIALSACGEHTHSYGDWTPNEDPTTGHYRVCVDNDDTQNDTHHIVDGECTECHYKPKKEEGKHEHVWSKTGTDNKDGKTHKLTCSGEGECDLKGEKNENHDTTGTDGACSVCGYKEDKQDGGNEHSHVTHVASNNNGTHTTTCSGTGDCDTYPKTENCDTEGEGGACSKCGYKEEPKHEHVWGEAIKYDATHHRYVCTGDGVCDEDNEKLEAHDELGDGGSCKACGYVPGETIVHEHVTHVTNNNNGTHTTTCSGAGECDTYPKTDNCDTEDEGKCSVCGYEAPKHQHVEHVEDNNDGRHVITCIGTVGECDGDYPKYEAHDTEGEGGVCSKCGHKEEAGVEHTLINVGDLASSNSDVSLKESASTSGSTKYTSAFNGEKAELTKYIGTGGAIKGKNGLKVEASADTIVYVYAYSGSADSERFLALYNVAEPESNDDFVVGTKQSIGNGTGSVLGVAKFEIKSGETKYIGSTASSVNIFAVGIVTGGDDEATASTVDAQLATCAAAGIVAHTITNYGRYLSEGTAIGPHATVDPQKDHDYEYSQEWLNSNLPTKDAGVDLTVTCKNDACLHSTATVKLPELSSEDYVKTDATDGKKNYTYTDKDTKVVVTFVADDVQTVVKATQGYTITTTSFEAQGVMVAEGELFTMKAGSALVGKAFPDSTQSKEWTIADGTVVAKKGMNVLEASTVLNKKATLNLLVITALDKDVVISIDFVGVRNESGTYNYGTARHATYTAIDNSDSDKVLGDPMTTSGSARVGGRLTVTIPKGHTVTIQASDAANDGTNIFICGINAVEK